MKFIKNKYGFWKQENPQPFTYTEEYKEKQSTNNDMSFLRLGWLASVFNYDGMKKMNMVDIGCGNGSFAKCAEKLFKTVSKYDVAGDSITKDQLYDTEWDLIVLSDVLEHFDDINDLFKLKFKYAFISYPETPKVDMWEELKTWRHFKPNEHIWCLNNAGMHMWLWDNKCSVVSSSNFEDYIRTRWDESKPNITSLLIKKYKYI
jgi:hypothetical protein